MNKRTLGQFYTTNFSIILNGLTIPSGTHRIIEPFCGNGDLLGFIPDTFYSQGGIVECYDIDPPPSPSGQHSDQVVRMDTLSTPPNYPGSFVLSNPPYLARNKAKDKTLFDLYDQNDLYKCFIKILLSNTPDGGILIVPLNFLCSIRLSDVALRKNFFHCTRLTE